MKKSVIIAFYTFIMSACLTLLSHPVSANEIDVTVTYKVQEGDSLYKIGKRTNNTITDLLHANKLSSDKLAIGQVLEIPVKSKEVFTSLTGMNYEKVVSVSVHEEEKKLLSVTDTSKQSKKTIIYQVQKGDTIDSISKKFKTDIQSILATNPEMENPNLIFIGQKILVPQN